MKNGPRQTGLLSILLLIIFVCLAVLATLALTTANADEALAEKSAEVTEAAYEREQEGQKWLAEADVLLQSGASLADLPGTKTTDGVTVKVITDGSEESLVIGLKENPIGGYQIVFWKTVANWESESEISALWAG